MGKRKWKGVMLETIKSVGGSSIEEGTTVEVWKRKDYDYDTGMCIGYQFHYQTKDPPKLIRTSRFLIQPPIGSEIKFTCNIEQGPTSETPAFIFAMKGQSGIIMGYNEHEGYNVISPLSPNQFGAKINKEFTL